MVRMTAPTSVKDELRAIIETLSTEQAEMLLDFINMQLDPDELTPDEEAEVLQAMAEFERGETISGEELERELGIEI
jgi:hypothetical protein